MAQWTINNSDRFIFDAESFRTAGLLSPTVPTVAVGAFFIFGGAK